MNSRRMAIYYEHPDWFRGLFAELDARKIDYLKLNASCYAYDPASQSMDFSLLFNRMSASAYLRGNAQGIFFTRAYLAHLDRTRVRVVNGSGAFALETSKALQLRLIGSLGLSFPKTRVVNCKEEMLAAAFALKFPILVKPNIGGRGAGIVRFDAIEQLRAFLDSPSFAPGFDQVALVQELIPPRHGHITRVETLGGKFLYAINIFTGGRDFNLCPAEICHADGPIKDQKGRLADAPKADVTVQACTPPPSLIAAVEKIVSLAGIEAGSVEYLTDDRDGSAVFYDINALSNFVAEAPRVVGFEPHARLVDYLEVQLGRL